MRKLIYIALIVTASIIALKAYETKNARLHAARSRSEPAIRASFAKAGVSYPAGEVFIRAFKRERELELWARGDGKFVKVATFPILAASGQPGPKRKEGDLQVPEGLYEIDRFNPQSLFHLSLGLNYPNASDRILSDRERPGSDIFIHGKNATIGCLPMGDEGIEQIYIAATDAKKKPVKVHIFPARMSGDAWTAFAAERPALAAFWTQLQPAYDYFEQHQMIPDFTVQPDGAYRITAFPR
jgi:murein L,D-transpeptidase YafK